MMRLRARRRLSAASTASPPTASPASSPRSTPAPRRPSASTSCTTSSSWIRRSGPRRRWEAALVDKPGVGKVIIGRGAVNQKGPEAAFLAALHAIRGAGPQAAGEPRAGRRGRGGDRLAALRADRPPARGAGRADAAASACSCPRRRRTSTAASRQPRRQGRRRAGAGRRAARNGAAARRRTSTRAIKARVDSPAWHLVQALDTLGLADGNEPAIDGFADARARLGRRGAAHDRQRPPARLDEATAKKLLGVDALGATT